MSYSLNSNPKGIKMKNIQSKLEKFVGENGKWSAHNIHLGNGVYTIKDGIVNDEFKIERVIQNIADLSKKDFKDLKILDLACLEGMFGIECALQGAEVTFLDARQINLDRVEFAIDVLNLENTHIIKDDVRNISSAKYGKFDVILCFGIFYHLDKNDLFDFTSRMYDMCTDFVFFDTHITNLINDSFTEKSQKYSGKSYLEHRSDASEEEKEADLWKSLDNQYSFMMTKVSLVKMLNHIGFSSVLESYLPFDRTKDNTRISLIAMKNRKLQPKSVSNLEATNEFYPPDQTFAKISSEFYRKFKTSIIYNLKLRSPRFVREFYKKFIKNKDYKKID